MPPFFLTKYLKEKKMNEEQQIMQLFYASINSRAIFTVGIFFMAWVALRIAKAVNENPNIVGQIVSSIFSVTVVFSGLIQQGFTDWTVRSTAFQLKELGNLSPSAQVFADTFYVGVPTGGQFGMTDNPLVWVFWLCLLAFMLIPAWTKNN